MKRVVKKFYLVFIKIALNLFFFKLNKTQIKIKRNIF